MTGIGDTDPLRAKLDEMRGQWVGGSDPWFHNGVAMIAALRAVLDLCDDSWRDTRLPGLTSAVEIKAAIAAALGLS